MFNPVTAAANFLRLRHAYRTVFASDDGKLVLQDLAKFAGLRQELAVPGDTHATYHSLGKRRVLLRILSMSNMSEAEVLRRMQQLEEDDRNGSVQA